MLVGSGWSASCSSRFTPGKDQVPIVQEAGSAPGPVLKGMKNVNLTGIRSPDHPARSGLSNCDSTVEFFGGTEKRCDITEIRTMLIQSRNLQRYNYAIPLHLLLHISFLILCVGNQPLLSWADALHHGRSGLDGRNRAGLLNDGFLAVFDAFDSPRTS
jgi:hypothetical protein